MAGKQENRIFVGGLSSDITERRLEDVFSQFGKILETQIMVERETGRPRGFGFITFSDRRAVEESIRDMHGREFGERTISVNRAEPKLGGGGDMDRGFGFSYPSSERDIYGSGGGGGDRLVAQDECFKCGRVGHWARECPTSGGSGGRGEGSYLQYSSRPKYPTSNPRTERFGSERDRFAEDRYDVGGGGGGGRYSERGADRVEGSRYVNRGDRYTTNESRYLPSGGGDRFGGGDRYGGSDRYLQNGYGKEKTYERESGLRGGVDRYDKYDRYGGASAGGGGAGGAGGGGPSRNERSRGYRGRPDPYDRPTRATGRLSSFDRY